MPKAKDKAEEFLEHVERSKSKNTFFAYKAGLEKFISWYGKSGTEIFEERKSHVESGDREQLEYFKHQLEEYYHHLVQKGYTRNTARVLTNGITGFFRFYGFPIELTSEISQKIVTTSDFVPSIELYRRMFQVGDIRAKVIVSMGLNLGWRIGDFATLKVKQLPDLSQEPPIPFEVVTEKEHILAKSFLSAETVELLKAYLPTLNKDNEYLFQSNGQGALQEQSINDILKTLAAKAKIEIPQHKKLRFHCFRKRFLSTCADLKVDTNIAKILVGKSVPMDMLTYLGEVNLKTAFLEVSKYLSLFNGSVKHAIEIKDEEIKALKTEIQELKIFIRGFQELFAEDLHKKVQKSQFVPKGMMGRPLDPVEFIKDLGRKILQKEDEQRQAEYEALLKNGDSSDQGAQQKDA